MSTRAIDGNAFQHRSRQCGITEEVQLGWHRYYLRQLPCSLATDSIWLRSMPMSFNVRSLRRSNVRIVSRRRRHAWESRQYPAIAWASGDSSVGLGGDEAIRQVSCRNMIKLQLISRTMDCAMGLTIADGYIGRGN